MRAFDRAHAKGSASSARRYLQQHDVRIGALEVTLTVAWIYRIMGVALSCLP